MYIVCLRLILCFNVCSALLIMYNRYRYVVGCMAILCFNSLTRGGVEDTRLEAKAKAKDTKKIRGQGQGQPFRGQTLSRPRTGMLQAKAKDQGHKAQVLSKKKKKKVFTKIFQAISTKKRFPKNFSTAPQNFNFPKNSAVLEPRTGQFSRTWGLEAKAKDLTFEAKAKDFKICPRGRPRGQGRPRGLHLCHWHSLLLINCKLYVSSFKPLGFTMFSCQCVVVHRKN